MLTLQINNPNFEFIQESYKEKKTLENFERSLRQAKLQESGELEELSLDGLIDELRNSSNA